MTIEDRVRRVLEHAVADEPPPRTAPLAAVRRRRRRRPVLVGAVAVVLVLAAVIGLAAIRRPDRPGPLPSTVPTDGWMTFTDAAGNLRFRYPPDWRVERLDPEEAPESYRLVPPELAGVPERQRNLVYLATGRRFWIGEDWFGTTSLGRLPGGQAYLRTDNTSDRFHSTTWSVDWGRPCLNDDRRCRPRSVRVDLAAADSRLWDRYHRVVATIVTTLTQLRPTAPSTGDASLPACRPDQWRLVWPEEYGGPRGEQGIAIQGGVQYLRGPRCHLRISVRLAVEDAGGRLLPVDGNPASMPLEMDLPIGGLPRESGSWVIGATPMWRFIWDEWCNRGLPRATLRLSADGAASITVPGLDPSPAERTFGSACQDRGRRSTVSAWP
jgi:hypothetical protein